VKQRIVFGAYEPDKAQHLTDGLKDMANAYPSANGYKPVGAFEAITDSLPAKFNGGSAFVDSSEGGTLLAGTMTNLYRYAAGWVSVVDSLILTNRWQFTQFGDVVIAVNGVATQSVDLVANTAGAIAGAPSATSVATVRDFVVYGGANGNASLVQWSGFNDYTKNTPGVDQAGYQPMLDGGDVQGIVGGEYGLIIQRSSVRRMTYTGDDFVWQFDVISPEIGAISKGSIAQSGRRVYFLSDRGFMCCDGTDVTPIGTERVDETFFKAYNRAQLDTMYAAIDPRRTTVAWLVPGAPGRLWVYNWTLDRWSIVLLDAIGVFSGFTSSISLEQLDALYPGGIDTIPFSLDSTRFSGGDPLLLLVNTSSQIGALSGDTMAASFTTPYLEMNDGRGTRLRAIRPLTDAIGGLSVTLDCRQRLGDITGLVSRSTLMPSGDMPVRASGRYISTQMQIAAGVDWSFMQGFEPVYASGGGR
jgi:hypothetical protein